MHKIGDIVPILRDYNLPNKRDSVIVEFAEPIWIEIIGIKDTDWTYNGKFLKPIRKENILYFYNKNWTNGFEDWFKHTNKYKNSFEFTEEQITYNPLDMMKIQINKNKNKKK